MIETRYLAHIDGKGYFAETQNPAGEWLYTTDEFLAKRYKSKSACTERVIFTGGGFVQTVTVETTIVSENTEHFKVNDIEPKKALKLAKQVEKNEVERLALIALRDKNRELKKQINESED